jgi:hypothetical protein
MSSDFNSYICQYQASFLILQRSRMQLLLIARILPPLINSLFTAYVFSSRYNP